MFHHCNGSSSKFQNLTGKSVEYKDYKDLRFYARSWSRSMDLITVSIHSWNTFRSLITCGLANSLANEKLERRDGDNKIDSFSSVLRFQFPV